MIKESKFLGEKNIYLERKRKLENNHKTNFLEDVEILENRYVGGDNFLMRVKSKNTQDSKIVPKAGQFYMLKLKNEIMTLRRPISLHSVDHETGELEFLYKVLGRGTRELTTYALGDVINIQGPLGNGFAVTQNSDKIVVVGGGIGLAPLKQLLKELLEKKIIRELFSLQVEEIEKH